MKISVVIPIYDMENGDYFLARAIDSVLAQTYEDYEIIVSDDSKERWFFVDNPKIKYVKNPNEAGMASNTNNAIDNASGEFIKILYQDDYLANETVLEKLAENLTDDVRWLVTACEHDDGKSKFATHYPEYQEDANYIGSPSVLTIHNSVKERFNTDLTWVLDLDLYRRLYRLYGEPKILNDVQVIIGLGNHQVTNKLTTQQKLDEELKI